MACRVSNGHAGVVEAQAQLDQPVAETLPEQYRAVLDRVAELESSGQRRAADQVRRDAIRAYSRAWNVRTAKRLDTLAQRADRLLASPRPDARRADSLAGSAAESVLGLRRRLTSAPGNPPKPTRDAAAALPREHPSA